MLIDTNITHLLRNISYVGLFVWLVIYNLLFFVPLPPAEIILVTVGYIGSLGHIDPFIAGILIVLTSWLSDIAFFILTLRGNRLVQKITQKFDQKIFTRFQGIMAKNPLRTLLILAFIPGVRFFSPIISGTLKINWKKYFLYDLTATTIFSAIYISLGYYFHRTIRRFLGELTIYEHAIFYPLIIIITIIIAYWIRKYFLTKKHITTTK